jgi:GAF domain-containing protein
MTIPVPDQKGKTIAVTQLINSLNEESFTESDVELTKAMSVFAGISLANSAVIEGSIRATRRVQALLETAVLLMQGGSLSSLLHHIMSVSRDLVEADRCSLFIVSGDNQRIKSTVLAGQDNQITVKRGRGVVGYVAEHNEVVNIPDAYQDQRFHSGVDQATGYHTRSILAAPVIDMRNHVFGVVEMINKDELYNGGVFTQEDVRLTTAFASFAGIAFDKTRASRDSSDGQTLAIMLSNMMTADESNSCLAPVHVVLPPEELNHHRTHQFDVAQLKTLDGFRLIATFFHELGFSSTFEINNAKLIRFLLALHDLYGGATFHSWTRTIEAAQFVFYLLTTTDLPNILTPLEAFALMIAALCHDVDHSETDNQSPAEIGLSVLYRNRPVMEMHHCEQTMHVITKAEQNIFEHVPEDQQSLLWQMIISLILGTDMGQHFELCSKMSRIVFPQNMLNPQSPQHRLLLAQIVLKCTDAAATTRVFSVNERWAREVIVNTHKKTRGSRPDSIENRIVTAKGQVGFILLVANPLFRVLVEVLPQAIPLLRQLRGNLHRWKGRAAGAESPR